MLLNDFTLLSLNLIYEGLVNEVVDNGMQKWIGPTGYSRQGPDDRNNELRTLLLVLSSESKKESTRRVPNQMHSKSVDPSLNVNLNPVICRYTPPTPAP